MGTFQKSCALALIVAFGATSAVAVPVTGTSNYAVDQTLVTQIETGAILVGSTSPAERRQLPTELPRRIRDLRTDRDGPNETSGDRYPNLMYYRCVYLERPYDECDFSEDLSLTK